jgi:hypothetical protein
LPVHPLNFQHHCLASKPLAQNAKRRPIAMRSPPMS